MSALLVEAHLESVLARIADRSARVGVLYGGMSSERGVSIKSGKAVLGALLERGWSAVGIDVGPDLPDRLRAEGVDVAWIALHGQFGEDGCVQGLLELMRVPYTGSGVRASAVAMDKVMTKRALRGSGVRLVPDAVWRPGQPLPTGLGLPLICKTPQGGSTIGIIKVESAEALAPALASLAELDAEVLVERFVTGEEITVAMLEGEALPVVSIRPVGAGALFDFAAKYTEGRTEYIVPGPISAAAAADATAQALAAWGALGLRGVARADFIIDADDQAWFLEVNTLPGMTATSLSPMAAGAVGLSFPGLVERVLQAATLHTRRADPERVARPGEAMPPAAGR